MNKRSTVGQGGDVIQSWDGISFYYSLAIPFSLFYDANLFLFHFASFTSVFLHEKKIDSTLPSLSGSLIGFAEI